MSVPGSGPHWITLGSEPLVIYQRQQSTVVLMANNTMDTNGSFRWMARRWRAKLTTKQLTSVVNSHLFGRSVSGGKRRLVVNVTLELDGVAVAFRFKRPSSVPSTLTSPWIALRIGGKNSVFYLYRCHTLRRGIVCSPFAFV